MGPTIRKSYLSILLLAMLTGCKPVPEEISPPDRPVTRESALSPGRYCYLADTDRNTTHIRLTVDASNRVAGDVQGTIHNQAASYYTSYRQALDGTIDGSNLNLNITTWIEYDRQKKEETWQASPTELRTGRETLAKESCDVVSIAFQDQSGLEAPDLIAHANHVKTEQIYFPSGKSGTMVSGAVERGDRDLYLLAAQGGQSMDISISSIGNNAVFDLVSPSGIILGRELTQTNILLPHTGDYQIIVGGTRGNATYELEIAIN